MIPLRAADLAEVVDGQWGGDPAVEITGPVVIDSRDVRPGSLFVALAGEHVDGHDFADAAVAAGAVAVLASRCVDGPTVLVDDATVALGALATHVLSQTEAPVIGITGSQGKTGVKDVLSHILMGVGPTVAPVGSFNNELGVPLTALRVDPATQFLVLEMGARGIGHIAQLCAIAPPDVAVVLNVGSAHVGEFGSTDAIAIAKGELVEALEPGGVAVLNADDPRVAAMSERTSAEVLTFGRTGDIRLGEVLLSADGHPHFSLTYADQTLPASVPQIGEHHAINGAAAVAAAVAAGIDFAAAVERLATAEGRSPSRMQLHVRDDGLVVIDDAYNANPESMAAALRALASLGGQRSVAVLGEMLELGAGSADAHRAVGQLARDLGIGRVLAVGAGAEGIAEGAGSAADTVADVEAAIEVLSESLHPDQVVLVKASRAGRLERIVDGLLQATSENDSREEHDRR